MRSRCACRYRHGQGEIVDCEECGIQLEVVGLDPVELDVVEEDDLDDDEDDDEY